MAARTASVARSSGRLLGFTLTTVVACGPSLQNVHEGTIRFEHCNRLDLDEHVAKTECRKCWTGWLADYTYGQPRDRIDYARRRAKSLKNGDHSRPALKVDEQSTEARQFYLVVPGPTSMRAPPPPIATVWKDADAGALAKTGAESPPAESCADECRSVWQGCCGNGQTPNPESGVAPPHGNGNANGNGKGATNGNGKGATNGNGSVTAKPGTNGNGNGNGTNGCSKCRTDYSVCMRRCFE